jgi:hypothetical protein
MQMRGRRAGAAAVRAAARPPRLDSLLGPDRNSCPIAPIQNMNLNINKHLTTFIRTHLYLLLSVVRHIRKAQWYSAC